MGNFFRVLEVKSKSWETGTYMYHPHINSTEQIDKGLYGAFIIDPQKSSGYFKYDKEYTMVLAGWNIPCGTYDGNALRNNAASTTGSTSTDFNFGPLMARCFRQPKILKLKKVNA